MNHSTRGQIKEACVTEKTQIEREQTTYPQCISKRMSCQPILEIHGLIDGVLVVLPYIGCMVEHIIPTGIAFQNAAEITLVVEPVSTNAATTTVPTAIFMVNGLFTTILGEVRHFFDEKCPYAIISVRNGYAQRPGTETLLFPVGDSIYSQLLPCIFETSCRLSLCGLYFCKNNRFCRLCR